MIDQPNQNDWSSVSELMISLNQNYWSATPIVRLWI